MMRRLCILLAADRTSEESDLLPSKQRDSGGDLESIIFNSNVYFAFAFWIIVL